MGASEFNGSLIRVARETKGWDRRQLHAALAEVYPPNTRQPSYTYLRDIEQGRKTPTRHYLGRIAIALGCDLDDLARPDLKAAG